jgi:D123
MYSIEAIDLQDVVVNDRIKYNTNNHWVNGMRPDDYDQKTIETHTNRWIDSFGIPYTKMTISNPTTIEWMKQASQVGKQTKAFSNLFRDELEQTLLDLETLYPHVCEGMTTGYFVRTEEVSLKYGCHGVGPYFDFKSILESIVTSMEGHSPITSNTTSITLYLIPWVNIAHEFRVFVYNNQITAISQQHICRQLYNHEDELRPLVELILREFSSGIVHKLSWLKDYVYDFAITGDGAPYFIECNPFGKEYSSGSALFHWICDESILYNSSGASDSVVVRYSNQN